MHALPRLPDPPRTASVLSSALFSFGDSDLLVEVLSSNPAGVVLVEAGPDLPIVYCNEAFRRLAGLARGPVAGRLLPEQFARRDRAALRAAHREVIRTGQPVHRRSAAHGPQGDDRLACWDVSHYPLRGPAGRVTHVLSFAVDVTGEAGARDRMNDAQHRVLDALGGIALHLAGPGDVRALFAELSATIAGLVSASRAAFWRYDPETETVSPQPGAHGFSDDELAALQGIPCSRGGPDLVARAVLGDAAVRPYLYAADPASEPPPARMEAPATRDTISVPWRAGQQLLGALAAYGSTRRSGFCEEDVWVLQAAAAAAALVWEHRQADDALADRRRSEAAILRRQIEQSVQLEQLKTDFLKLASHELRGPLAVVRGYVSMIEDGSLGSVGDGIASVLPLLRAKLDEMNQLIDELLDTARLEDSALQLRLAPVDLRDVAREAVRALEPLAGEAHELLVSAPDAPVVVRGDRGRLLMVVTNLVSNAIKYSPGGGEVRVQCGIDGAEAVVAVHDRGLGIAPEDLPRLFRRFGRIVTDETVQIGGTGLGLYLARDLARRHGGGLEVESEPGRGSTFTLRLPLAARPVS